MNRTQRRYKYKRPKSSQAKKKKNDLEEVLPARCRRQQMLSRCCYITPDQRSFAQLTNNSESPSQNQIQGYHDPHRPTSPDLKTIAEPVGSNKPEIITIAGPKRPTLPDMSTVAKHKKYQRTQPYLYKKTPAYRSPQPEVNTTSSDLDDTIAIDPPTRPYRRTQLDDNKTQPNLPKMNVASERSDQPKESTDVDFYDMSTTAKLTRSLQRTQLDANKKIQPCISNPPEIKLAADECDTSEVTKPKRSCQRTLPDVNKKAQQCGSNKPENTAESRDKNPITKPKRSYQRTQPDALTIAKASRSPKLEVNSATDPYISAPRANTIVGQYRPALPDLTIAQLRELQKVFFPSSHKIEQASQYVDPLSYSSYEEMMQWQNVENVDEIEKIVLTARDEGTLTQYHNLPKNLHISEVPRIKLMAAKFTKYKNENIEVRRVEEKVVCVEYDVFDEEDATTPVQQMRVFFSIKPAAYEKEAKDLTELPPTIKSKFNISTADLQKLNQKEIEIIDGKVLENQPYLDDLRKLLRRKENALKNKNTLNLQALYDMGKRDLLDFDTNFDRNTMPKEELVEMQNLILQNSKSSVRGIRRRTVKKSSKIFEDIAQNTMSQSFMAELLRESNKNVAEF